MDCDPKWRRNYVWLTFFILLGILGGFFLWFYNSGYVGIFLSKEKLLNLLNSMGPWSFAGFIFLQTAQVILAPIPGEVTGILGGFLYGPVLGVLLSTIGLTIGSYAAFGLSRIFGKPLVDRLVTQRIMRRFDYILHHKGVFLVFFLFLIPGMPKDWLCYILGLSHLNTIDFLVITGTGRLLGTLVLTFTGDYIRHGDYEHFFILLGITIVVILLAMIYKEELERYFRYLHQKRRR